MITVRAGSPFEEGAAELLRASHALMTSLYPAESNHYLSLEELAAPDIRFFVAEIDTACVGTGALALKPGYGEVKSMYTAESARGRGVADAILKRLTDVARAAGLPLLRLETGYSLHAAHRLYARHGFQPRGPFGDYPDDPVSVFMEKAL